MIELINVFPTFVYKITNDGVRENGKSGLDNARLKKEVRRYSKCEPSVSASNIGGYQGQKFYNQDLYDFVTANIPTVPGKEKVGTTILSWVNINRKGDYNKRHHHFAMYSSLFLSGVYYVSVPEDSGRIRFYDPRGPLVCDMIDQGYLIGPKPYEYIVPEDGMLLLFPPWLEHDVEPSNSEEERISIGLNILFNSASTIGIMGRSGYSYN